MADKEIELTQEMSSFVWNKLEYESGQCGDRITIDKDNVKETVIALIRILKETNVIK